jgi:hypothetical protein
VPRLRIWKWPMCGAASRSSGTAAAISRSRSRAAWRVIAPATSWPFSRRLPVSSATPLTSMRCAGRASRSASMGTRLCPPARTLASSPYSARAETASAAVRGA